MQSKKALVFIFLLFFLGIPKTALAADVVINEFLAHPSSGNKEWVEFYNPDNVDISSYWLDDDVDFLSDTRSSAKKNLTNIDKTDILYQYLEFDSFLNNSGDYVVLFSSDGNIVDQYQYSEDPKIDVSIGRSPNGTQNWVVLAEATKGKSNSSAEPTPTKTPTPTPTTKPTSTPKIPTPTKTPTPTPIKAEPTSSSILITSSVKEPTQNALPTSILGESTESAANNISPTDNPQITISPSAKETKTPASNTNSLSKILIGIGVILLISCGILAFRSYIKSRKENENIYHK